MSKCVDKYIHIYMKESEMNHICFIIKELIKTKSEILPFVNYGLIEQFLKRFLSSGLRPGFVMEINSIIKLMK